jgi:amino acid adenylation domain-containing protein
MSPTSTMSPDVQAPRGGFVDVVDLFEAHARRRPEAGAVTCGAESITYAELDRRANRVAHHLARIGVEPGRVVALCLSRRIELLVGMLGILKAGAAYLPQDLVYPRERLAFMLEDANAAAVLTLSGDRHAVPDTAIPVVCLDDASTLGRESEERPGIQRDPHDLAYVLYTSGSTGKPKGCQIDHANLASILESIDREYDLREDDTWSFFQSHAFDVSGFEIWGAFMHGARLVVVPHEITRSPEAFRRLLIDERVTVATETPTAFTQLIWADEAAGDDGAAYSLRYMFVGGEALDFQSLRPWFARHGDTTPRIVNVYGPTEATIYVTHRVVTLKDVEQRVGSLIGRAFDNTFLRVLDEQLQPVPAGGEGELFIGGAGVSRGYLNRPELNAERFIEWRNPGTPDAAPERLYRSGDLVRTTADGEIEYLTRIDFQVKIRGFRIELGEIEATLSRHPAVRTCVVLAREDRPGERRLVAYIVPAADATSIDALREHLLLSLPEYMVPAAFVFVEAMPTTPNGKLDRKALPPPGRERPALAVEFEPAADALEQRVLDAFGELLGTDGVGRHDNFFDLGGDSVRATRLAERIRAMQPSDAARVPVTLVFRHATPAALAAALREDSAAATQRARLPSAYRADARGIDDDAIAIIAMSGRFPGANDIETFWRNLCDGLDTITHFGIDGLDPGVWRHEREHPSYVPARGIVEGVEEFDPAFFGFSPKEAELMDPQHRIMLELSWECLERAGHVPDAATVPIGVFAGMHHGTYFQRHIAPRADLLERVGNFPISLLNEHDYVTTQVAHKLNLTGPAIDVQTACSTSLVAICQAVDSLRAGHCDMALAGGVSIQSPSRAGYVYQAGAMFAPDARTRTFDQDAKGTVFSDGAVIVLLKRLGDAIADGDPIHALIRGGAVNNDGRAKGSFTGPSSDGQAAVIEMAHRNARVDARSIGYVEAHGTATPLGDPIEIEGLTKAFRRGTPDTGFCRIGSVKSNVGHLVVAAGAAGLAKAALALETATIPASLHFRAPNPVIDFAATPFVVNATHTEWTRDGNAPRRAGVSSFGVGGTNAHVVLEEAPVRAASEPEQGPQLLTLSARSPRALERMCLRLAEHLEAAPGSNLADVAWTLAVGRKAFAHRTSVVASDVGDAVRRLRADETIGAVGRSTPARASEVVFLFPGQGATYPGMGRALYESEPAFRDAIDACVAALQDVLGYDLRTRMFSDEPDALLPTAVMQPATFALEYALARWWMAGGLTPVAMVGHSVGEFVAATLAGVFSLPDAARLVARRGALMQAQRPGSMLSVRLSKDALMQRLPSMLSLAAENAPSLCVVAGPDDAIAAFEAALEADGIACRRLRTSHAFHSSMMDEAVAPFRDEVAATTRAAPRIPIISTATARLLDADSATSADYWARHLREPVLFAQALAAVCDSPARVLLEVGPRATLAGLARQHPSTRAQGIVAVASLGDAATDEPQRLREAAGALWCRGVAVDVARFDRRTRRRRVRLPTYPFERSRYWIEAPAALSNARVATLDSPTQDVPMAVPTVSAPATPSRHEALIARLRDTFETVTGFEFAQVAADASFLELGLDSLTLTQVTQQVQKAFGVDLAFRELMGEGNTLAQLARLIESRLPADAESLASASMPPASPPAIAGAPTATDLAPTQPSSTAPLTADELDWRRDVIAQQLDLMRRQIEWLSSSAPDTGNASTSTDAPVPTAAALTAVSTAEPTPVAIVSAPSAAAASRGRREAADQEHASESAPNAPGAAAPNRPDRVALTAVQREWLDAFSAAYVERTHGSKAHAQSHRDVLADPHACTGCLSAREIAYPIVVERSKGAHLWDVDGNAYVDALNGHGTSLLGWQPEVVLDAVRAQLDRGFETGPQHPLTSEVARLVCELSGHERAALCTSGSEALAGAIRIARAVTGRRTIAVFAGASDGPFDGDIRSGEAARLALAAGTGAPVDALRDALVLAYGAPESLAVLRARGDDIAAVLVEPVQSGRLELQPREFLHELRGITRECGSLLVFDERITGFRADPRGAQGVFDVAPDLAAYGEIVGGGLSIGVIAGRGACMDALDGGAGNLGNDTLPAARVAEVADARACNPLALAAAKAVLGHLRDAGPSLQQLLNARTAALAGELNAHCERVGAPVQVRYFASMWRIAFTHEHPLQDLLFAVMRYRGVHVVDRSPCFLTTAHSETDIAEIADAFKTAVSELQDIGVLARNGAPAHAAFDPQRPPRPDARLGRDAAGRPAWFVPNPQAPGKYLKVDA